MTDENNTKRDNLKYAMCYIPFVGIVFFLTEKNISEEFNKHIKYGIFLLISYMILFFFLGWLFGGLLGLFYIGLSGYLGYKAYNGDKIELEVFDTFEDSVKNKIEENKKNEKK